MQMEGSGEGVILFSSTGSPNAFGRFVYFFNGSGVFWLSTASPNGSGGRLDFFKYWFAQRVWGFHFFLTYWSGGFGLVLPRPTGLEGFRIFLQVLVRPTGLGVSFFSSTGLPNGPGGLAQYCLAQRAEKRFDFF